MLVIQTSFCSLVVYKDFNYILYIYVMLYILIWMIYNRYNELNVC